MRRIFLTGITALVACTAVFSQNETDALRYSRIGFGGTARYSSMAGAFGALGADMSCLSTNPAGLGLYRKNEISFSPSFFTQTISSNYYGTLTRDSRSNLRMDNFGFVFAGKTENASENSWQNIAMGIAYNRYSSFQANYDMKGTATGSMMDSWAKTASGTAPGDLDQFNEGLAWETYLLNPGPGSNQYVSAVPPGDRINQEKTILTRGGMGEWTFGIGANYANRLYIGGSIGIPQVKYNETVRYTEAEAVDSTSDFDALEFNQTLITTGRGFNIKLGIIYRPIDLIRIGFAFNSPTVLKLSDAYTADMTSLLSDTTNTFASPNGSFNYSIRTPSRMIGSLAFIIGKTGLISADYEVVDYSEAHLKATNYTFSDANAAIQTKYKLAQNIRIGGEFRMLPFIVRGGFAWYGSPYTSGVDNNAAKLYITGGIGYRDVNDKFYIDLGIVTTNEKSNYYFYDQSMVEPSKNVSKVVNVIATVGFRY